MLRYQCDNCKELIENNLETIITTRNSSRIVMYDLCPKCLDEIRKSYGDGREVSSAFKK